MDMAEPNDDLLAELLKLPPATKDAVIDALFLPKEAQQRLAGQLEDSLPEQHQEEHDIDPELAATLERRIGEVERGEVELIPAEKVFAEMRAFLDGKESA